MGCVKWGVECIQVERDQREQQDAARAAHSSPPPCGEGRARQRAGWGSWLLREACPLTATPTPNPSPQGGGEQTQCAAKANEMGSRENARGCLESRSVFFHALAVLILRSVRAEGVAQTRTRVHPSRRMRTVPRAPSCFETHRSALSQWTHPSRAAMLLSMKANIERGCAMRAH